MDGAKRLLVLEDVACIRGQRLLFQNLSCALDPGDVLHLSGPNGAGKTSLLRMIAGALPPAAGKLLWDGTPFLENGVSAHAHRFSFLPPDDRALKVLESANENLIFWARLAGADTDAVPLALGRLGLAAEADMPLRRLSAGQRRRVSLARLLLKSRALWLLDEPFNGLDTDAAGRFNDALNNHVRGGGMAVIASHQGIQPPQGGALRRLDLGGKAGKAA